VELGIRPKVHSFNNFFREREAMSTDQSANPKLGSASRNVRRSEVHRTSLGVFNTLRFGGIGQQPFHLI
jgi:hypothetical protein